MSSDEQRACACGFDFETRDPSIAIARLTAETRAWNRVWRRGLILLFFLPLTFGITESIAMFAVAAMAHLGLSLTWIVRGIAKGDSAARKLASAHELKQLPAARVVKSD